MTSLQDAALVAKARGLAASGEARRIRVAHNVPIGDMARTVGVTVNTVWRWENGVRAPRGETAIRYARVLATLAAQ